MKSTTLLDSVVFQLTPTRTRCDLVITANGKSEKIASGLLNPFLAHLKAAQDQIGKGGYSIVLEPDKPFNAKWFTKGTVERFVRFVSSPEILERVYTIESEILQIQKAISFQNDNGSAKVKNSPVKFEERLEGNKSVTFGNDEKAMLYQPASHQSEEDASIIPNNSKVQLVRVLETRKSVLQKEQGMAFARALTASFDTDNITTLLAFANCFGASRMKDACQKFLDLWKAKHENGQWVEVEAISCQSDMPYTNASGIVFLGQSESQRCESVSGKSPSGTDQGPPNPQEHTPSQFPHPMFPPCQAHPQTNGIPLFQPFPMQGTPYYPNYMGQSPFLQSPYTSRDDSKIHSGRKTGRKTRRRRHSMDTQDLPTELETQEYGSKTTSDNDDETNNEDESSSKNSKNKGGKSSRKNSGTVVIQNLNYISSEKQDSYSDDEKNLKKRGGYFNSKEERMSGKGGDGGNWKAFENFLLNNVDENNNSTTSGLFGMEGKALGKKRQSAIGESQTLSYGQGSNPRHRDSQTDLQTMEDGGRSGRSGDLNMDYMINRRENLMDVWDPSLDPVIRNGYSGRTSNANKGSLIGKSDESFMVLQRAGSTSQVRGDKRKAMDMDCELASTSHRHERDLEPHDLNLMPNRAMEGRSSGYDLAMDYEIRAQNKNLAKSSGKKEVGVESKGGPRKKVKDQELKGEKRTITSLRRPSKLSPVEDARARAERVRAYKADLQKLKKEKEEEQRKRLETLKIEREKRIATKRGANPSLLQSGKRQVHKLSPVSQKGSKFSDLEIGSSSPLQRSKLKIISEDSRSLDVNKVSKSGRLNNESQTNGNRLTQSTSLLRTQKEDKKGPIAKSIASMSKTRILSESKGTFGRLSESKMSATSNMVKQKSSRISEVKVRASNTSKITVQNKSTKEMPERAIDNIRKSTKETPQRTFDNVRKSTREMSQRTSANIRKSTKDMPERTIGDTKKSTKEMPRKRVDNIQKSTKDMRPRTIENTRKSTQEVSQRTTDNTKKSTKEMPQRMVDNTQKSTKEMPQRTIDILRKSTKDIPQKTIDNVTKSTKDMPERTIDNTKKSTKETPQSTIDNILPSKDVDDNTIVEKTVVMLECEKPSTPIFRNSNDKIGVRTVHFAVQNQASKQEDDRTVKIVDREKSNCIVKGKIDTHTRLNEKEKVLPNEPSIDPHKESYQPPYARVSSHEDSCLTEPEYVKAAPSVDMEVIGGQATKAYVSDTRRSNPGNNNDIIRESDSRKYQDKESSKGFKRLLMFGKKYSSTSEVFTVKNLMKQKESTSAGTTPMKSSSRPFSLLSHFRSKNIEKKLTT